MIETSANFTLKGLAERAKRGEPVYRTPHVGNLSIYNLALASAGIPIICFDRNMTVRDQNYMPDVRIAKGVKEVIACDSSEVLVPYAQPIDGVEIRPASLHWRAQKETLNGGIQLETGYWLQHQEHVRTYLKAIKDLVICDRRATNGRVQRDFTTHVDPESFIDAYHRYHEAIVDPLAVPPHDLMVISNTVAIAMQAFIAHRVTGYDEVVEVSGPDMIRYVEQADFVHRFGRIVDILQRANLVSPNFRLLVIPSTAYRFAVPQRQAGELDELVMLLREIISSRQGTGQLSAEAKQSLKEAQRPIKQRIRELKTILPQPYNSSGTFYTHYDLLDEVSTALYVPEVIKELPYKEIQEMDFIMNTLNGRGGS